MSISSTTSHPNLFFLAVVQNWTELNSSTSQTPIGFFTKLGIPYPEISAYVVGATECFGGILIVAGLGSRLAAIPVTIAMAVALWVPDQGNAILNIWGHPDKFLNAAPFPFFLAALIVLCFGPGWFSLDAIFGRLFRRRREE